MNQDPPKCPLPFATPSTSKYMFLFFFKYSTSYDLVPWFSHDVCARWAILTGARPAPPQDNRQAGLMVSSKTEQNVVFMRLISLRPI